MTNAQCYTGIAIPCILILLGWLHQNSRLSDLRTDMITHFAANDRQFDRLDKRLALIEADQKQFFKETGRLDGRLDELSRGK